MIDTADLAAALDELGVRPALAVEGGDLLRIARRIGGREVVFLANPSPEPTTVTVRTSSGRPLVAWDPVSLQRRTLRGAALTLPPVGSVLLVEGGDVDGPSERGSSARWRSTARGS